MTTIDVANHDEEAPAGSGAALAAGGTATRGLAGAVDPVPIGDPDEDGGYGDDDDEDDEDDGDEEEGDEEPLRCG